MQVENLYMPGRCIRTFTGIYIKVFEPTPEMVRIEDIAHALAQMPRFGGHLPEFYSVAQHSLLMAELTTRPNRLAALLHDASEAYLIDVPKPIKEHLTNYNEIEDKLMSVIAQKFGFEYPLCEEVKRKDKYCLELEWESLMLKKLPDRNIIMASRDEAEGEFLKLFNELKAMPEPINPADFIIHPLTPNQ